MRCDAFLFKIPRISQQKNIKHQCCDRLPQTFWVFAMPSRLKPRKITFPAHDADEWAKGDRRTAAFDVSVDKLISHNLHSAPDIEKLVSRISNFKLSDFSIFNVSCTCSHVYHMYHISDLSSDSQNCEFVCSMEQSLKALRFYAESENSRQHDDGPTWYQWRRLWCGMPLAPIQWRDMEALATRKRQMLLSIWNVRCFLPFIDLIKFKFSAEMFSYVFPSASSVSWVNLLARKKATLVWQVPWESIHQRVTTKTTTQEGLHAYDMHSLKHK